jgi:hypothetical protein
MKIQNLTSNAKRNNRIVAAGCNCNCCCCIQIGGKRKVKNED